MKALILSAGFGTRLLPYSTSLPKPLFPVAGRPVIHTVIDKLVNAGINKIIINTHHLHRLIESYIADQRFPVRIDTLYEPEILGTGGAVKNASQIIQNHPVMVVNSDIVFNLDLNNLMAFHKKGGWLSTLVVHRYEKFNNLTLDRDNFIQSFRQKNGNFAFTGIQIISPELFHYMPRHKKFSIITLYQSIVKTGLKLKAYIPEKIYWRDIGTIQSYKYACMECMANQETGNSKEILQNINIKKLKGDGSDREWFRIILDTTSFIAADHGIEPDRKTEEMNSFVKIGRHLYKKQIPVPRILKADFFPGIVITEDLGDTHLEDVINSASDEKETIQWYESVCDCLVDFSVRGIQGFSKEWTCETAEYSVDLVLHKECGYFIEAFIQGYLNRKETFDRFAEDFKFIAEKSTDSSFTGLMHRDMQSRNIMVNKTSLFFIDFQSARKGPVEYDVASLLIDPYVNLSYSMRHRILDLFVDKMARRRKIDRQKFYHCYSYCCIARSLQILGAFSHLTRVKQKKKFEKYIPFAVDNLKRFVADTDIRKIPELSKLITDL